MMPIDYKEYHPQWHAISRFVRKVRALDKCEWCGRENGLWYLYDANGEEDSWSGTDCKDYADIIRNMGGKAVRIVLTVAHIDHDKENNELTNLAALCQRCHLNHDRKQHANNRKYGRNWKKGQGSLFDVPAVPLVTANADE